MQKIISGIVNRNGYIDQLLHFVTKEQLLDSSIWKLFVDQYREKADTDNGWRGEYWGKMMRGAVLTYLCTADENLYFCMKETVLDLLSTQEADGRISSYPKDKELDGWDLWARKYVLLGCLYFYDICKDEALKPQIKTALCRHLDYIIERIGDGKGQKSIFKTSRHYGGLNSCSILEPVVKMYKLTKDTRYFDFATYIVNTGFCQDMNLIELCLNKTKPPYLFTYTKAYEMMSCFQGLLEYYEVTGTQDYLQSVINFAETVSETEITIIGCAGCMGENFNNAYVMQTEYSDDIMQETCVTVTWMNLCFKLLQITEESKYANWLERSALNAMGGAVNTDNQAAARANVWDGSQNVEYKGERGILPFDSYSPLYKNRRGRGIGGFNVMKNGSSYGCCAAIGAAGVALSGLFGIMEDNDGICINFYENIEINTTIKGNSIVLKITADLLDSGKVKIEVQSDTRVKIKLRIPDWSNMFKLLCADKTQKSEIHNGYVTVVTTRKNECIELDLDNSLKKHFLNGKVAFTKGPYVMSSEQRISKTIKPLSNFINTDLLDVTRLENTLFPNIITLQISSKEETLVLCDYASAGKNFDDENCDINVWHDLK